VSSPELQYIKLLQHISNGLQIELAGIPLPLRFLGSTYSLSQYVVVTLCAQHEDSVRVQKQSGFQHAAPLLPLQNKTGLCIKQRIL